MGNLNGVYGVKTGFTNGAGRCLVTSTFREDMDVICVVLGADTKKIRTSDSVKLINYSFNNYDMKDLISNINLEFEKWKNEKLGKLEVKKAVSKKVEANININNFIYPLEIDEEINIEIKEEENLEAPIEKGEKIGELNLEINNKKILSQDIILTNTIERKTYLAYLYQILSQYKEYLEQNIQLNTLQK